MLQEGDHRWSGNKKAYTQGAEWYALAGRREEGGDCLARGFRARRAGRCWEGVGNTYLPGAGQLGGHGRQRGVWCPLQTCRISHLERQLLPDAAGGRGRLVSEPKARTNRRLTQTSRLHVALQRRVPVQRPLAGGQETQHCCEDCRYVFERLGEASVRVGRPPPSSIRQSRGGRTAGGSDFGTSGAQRARPPQCACAEARRRGRTTGPGVLYARGRGACRGGQVALARPRKIRPLAGAAASFSAALGSR